VAGALLAGVASIAVAVALSVGAASAQTTVPCYPPGPGCATTTTVNATTTTAVRGIRILGRGHFPGEIITVIVPPGSFRPDSSVTVTITAGSRTQTLGTFSVGPDGSVRAQVTIPCDANGAATIIVTGTEANGAPTSLEAPLTVNGPSACGIPTTGLTTSGPLAFTGSMVLLPAAVLGLALVAGGLLLRRGAKRRSPARAS
jgi:hypothetical protein